MIDLRGHGYSTQDEKFRITSWTYYTDKTFKKYPSDVIDVINQVKKSIKKVSFNNYSIIGGDIGANTAVLVAQKMYPKPKSMVLLSPSVEFKGLTIASLDKPSPIAEVGHGPILVMCSRKDKQSIHQEMLLKKFVNTQYIINNYDNPKSGMLLIKNNPDATKKIIELFNENMK